MQRNIHMHHFVQTVNLNEMKQENVRNRRSNLPMWNAAVRKITGACANVIDFHFSRVLSAAKINIVLCFREQCRVFHCCSSL